MSSKEKTYFAVEDFVVSVSRNREYPVKNGTIAVTDADDAEAFRGQGYREVAAPAKGNQAGGAAGGGTKTDGSKTDPDA